MKSLINLRLLLFCALSLSLISWDRVSKDMAKEYLRNKPDQTFLHDSFRLEYVENTGAAMSMGDNLSPRLSFWLLGILSRLMPLALIFSGGMGNILDRLLFNRHVTDFMSVGIASLRSAIFNFADLWITIGVVWVALEFFKKPAASHYRSENV